VEHLTLRDYWLLQGKRRDAEGRRIVLKFKTGDDLHHATGRWMKLDRTIDRERNQYDERIVDPVTGAVVHECHEPLDKHRGHGDDKKIETEKSGE
jgi:hypothetical protein